MRPRRDVPGGLQFWPTMMVHAAHNDGACCVRAVRRILFRSNLLPYDACSMYTVSICFRDTFCHETRSRRFYSVEDAKMVYTLVLGILSINLWFHGS